MRIKSLHILILISFCVLASYTTSIAQTGDWKTVTKNGITHRHECSFAEANGKFILIGGRGVLRSDSYNPTTNTWTKGTNPPPFQIHHFQAVTYDGKIYIVGAFTNGHPEETPIANVYIYDPTNDSWTQGPLIPEARRRGATGAVLYNNKIYVVGGAVHGHVGDNVSWLDEFDPATGVWTPLTDAPHARDHFQAAVSGDKLYLAGGRLSKGTLNSNGSFTNQDVLVNEVDVYNFTTKAWETYPNNIPTGRAGTAAAVLNNELLIIGGEVSSQLAAHNKTEAMHLDNKTWRTVATLDTGRHATHALVYNNKIYIASGSKSRGGSGSSELNGMEEFTPDGVQQNSLSMPSEINFGQVIKDQQKTMTLTMTNTSTSGPITINSITLVTSGGDFAIGSKPTTPHVVAAGASATVDLIFNPGTLGNKTATLNITHTGENSPFSVTLKGESVLNVTAINKGNYFNSAVIYPNPARNEIIINNVEEAYTWEILNTAGVSILKGEGAHYNMEKLDIGNLTEGVYILTLKSDKEEVRKSFLLKKE